MASTSSTIRIIFDGTVDGLRRAARQAESDLNGFNRETDRVNRGLSRIFTTGTKATAALGTVGSAVPLMAGLASSATTAAGALLVLPAAALSGAAAVGVLKLATTGFADAVTAADPKAFAEATKEMAPAAIDTANALRAMRPEFVGLKQDVQGAFFKDFAGDARALGSTYLPVLRPQLTGIATGFNAMGREAARALMAPAAVKDVNTVLGDTNKITADLKPALGNVLTGILAIAGQGSAEFRGFGAVITDATTRFKDWARQAAESGRITELIREGKEELAAWGEVGSNVGSILATIFDGITDDQGNFADSLVETTAAVEAFLKSVEGQEALQALGETLRVTGAVIRDVLMAALRELGPIITASAPAVQEFARVLGGILVDAIHTVGPMIQAFGRFLSENRGIISATLPVLAGLVLGFKALQIIQAVAGWVASAAAAIGGLSFLLGPLGIALAAAAGVLYLFLNRHLEAARAADAHRAAIQTLKGTLDQYTGAVTEATRAQTAQDIASRKLSDGTTTFSTALRAAGISFNDYSEAASGNADALAKVNSQLFIAAQRTPGLQDLYAKWKFRLDEAGVSFETFTAAAIGNSQAFDELTTKLGVSSSGIDLWKQDLAAAVGPLGELGSALGEYNGVLKEAQEQTRLAAGVSKNFATILDTIKSGLAGLKDGAAPLPPMVAAFKDLNASATEAAIAAGKSAAAFGGVDAGAKAARDSMQASREAFIQAAEAAGLSAEQAAKLADQIGLIPASAETQFRTNATGVAADLLKLNDQIKAVPGQKSLTLNSNSPELIKQLEELGFKVKSLPNGQLEIDLQDENARKKLEAFTKTISTLSAAPKLDLETSTAQQKADAMKTYIDGLVGIAKADADAAPGTEKANQLKTYIDGITGILTVDGNPQPGTDKANQLQEYINGLVGILTADADNAKGKAKGDALREYINQLLGIMTADANTRPGKDQADALKNYVDRLRGTIQVSANTSSAESDINHTARPRSTTITVNVRYNDPGPPNVRVAGGGIIGYSGGGLVPRFDGGGWIPGYAPGRDTVHALLSRGEAVLVPELVRAIGARYILAANKAASGRPGTIWSGGRGLTKFAGGGIATARQYLMAGLNANGGSQAAVATVVPETAVNVKVFLGDTELRGLVRTEIDTKNRDAVRTVRAGSGVRW